MNSNNHLYPIYTPKEWSSAMQLNPSVPKPTEIWTWLEDGHVILWTHAGISVGTVKNKEVQWQVGAAWAELPWDDHLVELRAFGPGGEWRLWRTSTGLKGRKRWESQTANNDSEVVQAIDCSMDLRGVIAAPLQALASPGKPKLLLKTRHYFGANGFGMTEYSDVRFVEIINHGGQK